MLNFFIGFALGAAFMKYAWPRISKKLWSKTGSSLDA